MGRELFCGIGSGKAAIAQACRMARSGTLDGVQKQDVIDFALLGSWGRCPSNAERDLHTWTKRAWGFTVEPYYINVTFQTKHAIQPRVLQIPILLPFELFHAAWESGPKQFDASFIGGFDPERISEFWKHAFQFPDWGHHPLAQMPHLLSKAIPFTYHADGAEIHSNTEFWIWSWGSPLAQTATIDQ